MLTRCTPHETVTITTRLVVLIWLDLVDPIERFKEWKFCKGCAPEEEAGELFKTCPVTIEFHILLRMKDEPRLAL